MGMFKFHRGSMVEVFLYVATKGVSPDSAYPLREKGSRFCRETDRKPYQIGIRGVHRLTPNDEENLKKAVALIGPVAVKIHVNENFLAYRSGVFYDRTCVGRVNHGVLVVGYGTDSVAGDFWIVKNSWGPYWGENGYIRMARNTVYDCGIASVAFYAAIN